jgi:HEPN domain-containing protein
MNPAFLVFGKKQGVDALSPIILSDIGKSCFVLARIQLRKDFFQLSNSYIVFHLIHHSIETYLKAFLSEASINFDHIHKLVTLREEVTRLIQNQDKLLEILHSTDTTVLLRALDSVYAKNKYGEVGYHIDMEKLRATYDLLMEALISTFFEFANREDRPVAERIQCVELTEAQQLLFDYGDHPFKLLVWPSM